MTHPDKQESSVCTCERKYAPPLSFWYGYIARLRQAADMSDIFIALCEIARYLDFDYCAYLVRVKSNSGESINSVMDTFPGTWFRSYMSTIDTNADPIFAELSKTCSPIKWSRKHLRKRRFLYKAAVKIGLRHGVSLPFRGPNGTLSIFSIARRRSVVDESKMFSLTVILYPLLAMAHDAFLAQSIFTKNTNPVVTLTNREKQVLIQAAEGRTSVEIAGRLMVTERTINFHIENVLRKLNVRNRAHAIARANAIGLISY